MYKFLFAVSFFGLTTFKFYIDKKNSTNFQLSYND